MQFMRPLAVLLAAALAGCAGPSRAGREGGEVDRVALRFAWNDGLRLRVAVRHESWRTGRPPAAALIRHQVVVERRGDELWVSNRGVEGQGNEPDLDLNLRMGEALVQVVGLDGAYRRTEGLEAALAQLPPADQVERARVRETLDRATAQDWETSVGAWHGLTLASGAMRRKEVAASVPLIPGVASRLEVEYGLEALVPCGDEETERRCAALVYRGEPAASDRAATLERLKAIFRNDDEGAVLEDFHGRLEITLLTDPATLLPRRMVAREELRLRVRLGDGRVREIEERSRDEYRFEVDTVI
jgi:hypothetical protein